jgi:hypothetical protein
MSLTFASTFEVFANCLNNYFAKWCILLQQSREAFPPIVFLFRRYFRGRDFPLRPSLTISTRVSTRRSVFI